MFVCFHAGGLRSHVYLTRVLLSAGSPLCFSVTLTTSPRSLPHCPASPPLCSSPPGTAPVPALSCSSFPAPAVPWGLPELGSSRCPFPVSAPVDFQAESRQQVRAELLRLLILLMAALGFRGAVFRDCAPCRKQWPGPVSESGVSQAW